MQRVMAFLMAWGRQKSFSMLLVLFQTLLVLFLMGLGFSTLGKASSYLASVYLISAFFMGQFLMTEFHTQLKRDRTLQSLLLRGFSPHVLFGATLLWASLVMFAVELLLWVLTMLFFVQSSLFPSLQVVGVLVLFTLSYVALGLLFYSMMIFSKIPSALVMMIFFSILVPVFLFTHKALDALVYMKSNVPWGPLLGMTILFVFSSMLLYEFCTEDRT